VTELLAPGATLERVFGGTQWGEGPLWIPALGKLRWSDVVGNAILEHNPATGATSRYAAGTEFVNGRALDLSGNVVQCSHGLRRVERDAGGTVSPVVDRYNGHRLNSPNDVVVASDGSIWFSDPPYGLDATERQGHGGEQEYGGCFVFRYEESTSTLTAVITDLIHPHGLAFSPDESILYVADTGIFFDASSAGAITAYEVVNGECSNPRQFAAVRPGAADGFRVDESGRIWSSSMDSVQVFDHTGDRLLVIPVPDIVTNLCFGGPTGSDLYITGTKGLYKIPTNTVSA
jgi:gluconolactonase